jgi:hypothetical protein
MAPERGPEHERLGFWIGEWMMEGKVNENPMMPAGPTSGSEKCEWFDGKFAVICHTKGKSPMGEETGLGILSYNAEAGVYTYYGVNSSGWAMTTVPRGTIDGKTWVYDDESEMGGMTIKGRYTITETSENTFDYTWQMMMPDGSWATIMEGKAKKKG